MKKNTTWKSVAAVGVLLLALLLLPVVYKGNYFYTVLCQIVCYFIAIVGLNFITGMTGQPMLGMAGVFAIGSYTSALLTTKGGMNAFAAMPIVLVVGLIVGLILGYPSLRLSGVYLSFTTIGFSEIVRILLMNLTNLTGGGTGIKGIPNYVLFGFEFKSMQSKLYLFIAIALLVALFANRIVKSKWGKSFLAIRDNIEAVPSCGINVTNVKLIAFCLTNILGCLAGALYAHMTNYITPTTYTQTLSITMLSMLIIGGMGSIWGCLIGTSVVILLPEVFRFLGRYYDLVYAVVMLVVVVTIPGGLVNLFRKDARKIKLADITKIFIGGRG